MKVRKRTATLKLADYYMGRDREYRHELTPAQRANARETVRRVNRLLKRAGLARKITSVWRPAAVNATVPGAARGSKHISCIAIDLEDHDGALDAWCLAHHDVLEDIGLWLEHPDATPDWCHLQTVPRPSGNRVFEP